MRVLMGLLALVLGCSGCTVAVTPAGQPAPHSGGQSSANLSPESAVADVRGVPGVFHEQIADRNHSTEPVTYDRIPPIGGRHDPVWADCTGTVYTSPIRDENAVHSLEHGAVWITYRTDLPADQVAALAGVVDGHNYTFLSPYPRLPTAVSLQAWGWQVRLDHADLDTVRRFVRDLADNPVNAPEPHGICANPDFRTSPVPPR